MTKKKQPTRAELQAMIDATTDPARKIALQDLLETIDEIDDLEHAHGGPVTFTEPVTLEVEPEDATPSKAVH